MKTQTPRLFVAPQAGVAEAERALAAGNIDMAETTLQRVLREQPDSASANGLLAIVSLMRGRPADAVRLAGSAVLQSPANAQHCYTLGRAHKAAGDLEAASKAYRQAVTLKPGFAEAHVSLGIALKGMGELDAAIACHERALALNPKLAAAHANLATTRALRTLRDNGPQAGDVPSDEDIEGLRHAVSLDPQDPELHRNHGLLLQRAGRHDAAARAFNEALTRHPADIESCLGLGKSLVALGGYELAREAYEKWLGMNEKNAKVMGVLAGALVRMGEADAGLEWAQRAIAIEPNPITAMEVGSALIQLRRLEEGLALCRRALDDSGRDAGLYPVYLLGLNYLHEDPAPIAAAHAEFGALAPLPAARPAWCAKAPGARLRVGYVSGDFMRHSVSFFAGPVLEHHDKNRFEVFCYHNNPRSDHVTARFKAFGHRWVECAHMTDDGLARRITADGIDILVDLAGPTAQSRVLMFALAPAPVQVAYLGYPTATGVPSMDYRITDAVIDPHDLPAPASEAPLRLPHTMFCFQPDEAPALAPPPARRNGLVTFGSFNNAAKITDHTLALWAAVLSAVPGSRLLLKSSTMGQPSLRLDIERFMAARDIAPDRLTFQARAAEDLSHLALYNEVDIALDTFPYNGATTTCEALWMGLPVVTRRGSTHTSLMGASLLGAVGRQDCVAATDDDFVARAVALADDVEALAAWRASARAHLMASPLLDHAGFTRDFEALLLRAWALQGERQGLNGLL